MRQAAGGSGWIPAIALSAALILVVLGADAVVPELAIAAGAGHGRGGPGAWARHFLNCAFYAATWGCAALFLGATAVVALTARGLPH